MNLYYNKIGAEGDRAIAEALKTNQSLQQMNLDGNQIGTEGARAIFEALKRNNAIMDKNVKKIGTQLVEFIRDKRHFVFRN